MNRKYHALLWATAIIASAIVHAPQILTLGLLPILACCSIAAKPDSGYSPGQQLN